ncbi:MAG: ATP-binding protein [Myxococcota bacterium]
MSDDELIRLRAQCQKLDEQLKLLVKTEHRLYVSRGERDAQIRRVRALAAFAFSSQIDERPLGVLERAMQLVAEVFNVDSAATIRFEERGSAKVVLSTHGLTEVVVPEHLFNWAQALGPTIVDLGRDPSAEAMLLARSIHPRPLGEGGFLALAPVPMGALGQRMLLVALNEPRRVSAYRQDHLGENELPFWQLLASHVERALHNVVLADGLRQRTEELARSNAELVASVEKLERTKAALVQSQKMEAIGQLAGGVAHDFNNLLTVILSHAALLEDGLSDEGKEDLSAVIGAAQRAAAITRQLLVFGRRQPQRRSVVDLSEATATMARMLSRLIGEHITLSVRLHPGGAWVDADPVQIEQVLLNLVVNARDAMPEGGTLEIVTRPATPEDLARVGGGDPAGFFALEVRDTGHGIDEAVQAKIFEPFFTTKEVGKGTGLGLAVVYGAVTQTGGYVFVRSALGQGATFTVLLPRPSQAELEAPEHPPRADVVSARGRHVLVVEDEDSIRNVTTRILRHAGYRVTEARNGREAMNIARAEDIDLLLSDMVMPEVGGARLAAELRPGHPGMRVLFMSGYSLELAEGMACIEKPFSPAALLERVRTVLAEPIATLGANPRGPEALSEAERIR